MNKNKYKEKSDFQLETEFLREITKAKRDQKEPGRCNYVLRVLREMGFNPEEDKTNKCVRFEFHGNTITIWPYTGWFSGRGIKDGRGIKKLLKQLQ